MIGGNTFGPLFVPLFVKRDYGLSSFVVNSVVSVAFLQSEFADPGATNVNGIDYTKAIYVLHVKLARLLLRHN